MREVDCLSLVFIDFYVPVETGYEEAADLCPELMDKELVSL
jgi:hypothetical protein